MKRLLVLLPTALFAFPAIAQTAPEGAYQDLWCGIAFGTAAANLPYSPEEIEAAKAAGDAATDDQKEIVAVATMFDGFIVGAAAMVERSTAAYKEAGFTAEAFAKVKTDLEPTVLAQISGSAEAEFSQEECSAMLPPPADAPAAQ